MCHAVVGSLICEVAEVASMSPMASQAGVGTDTQRWSLNQNCFCTTVQSHNIFHLLHLSHWTQKTATVIFLRQCGGCAVAVERPLMAPYCCCPLNSCEMVANSPLVEFVVVSRFS